MSRWRPGLVLACIAAVFALPLRARASVVDDVINGGSVDLDQVTLRIEGHDLGAGRYRVAKVPGSLDMVVDLRALGIDADGRVLLHGTRSGDTISWAFSYRLTTPADVGGGVQLEAIEGALVAQAAPSATIVRTLPGGGSRTYDVKLGEAVTGSWVRATLRDLFHEWTSDASNIHLSGAAGLGPVRPIAVGQPGGYNQHLCARNAVRVLSMQVALDGRAPLGGARFHVASSQPVSVSVRDGAVGQGVSGVAIPVTIAAGWSGDAQITVYQPDGTALPPVGVHVLSESSCRLQQQLQVVVVPLVLPQDFSGCPACLRVLHFADDRSLLFAVDGKPFLLSGTDVKALSPRFGAGVASLSINDADDAAGTRTLTDGSTEGFLALAGADAVPLSGGLQLGGLNGFSAIAGTRVDPKLGSVSAVVGVPGSLVSAAPGAKWSRAVALNGRGDVVGAADFGNGAVTFLSSGGKLATFSASAGESWPVALNEAGELSGRIVDTKGQVQPFIASLQLGLKAIPIPNGLANARPVGINGSGHVALTASQKPDGADGAFLYADGQLFDLSTSIIGAKATALEALAINDLDEVLVRGVLDGQESLFILSPAVQSAK